MITGATKNKVDDIWQRMWEGGVTNPIEVIMQLTYLMFMKSLDDKELEAENMEMLGMTAKHVFPQTEEGQAIRWSRFKDLPAEQMFDVVSQKAFPFIKTMHSDNAFAESMEDAAFGFNKPKTLEKAVSGIDDLLSNYVQDADDLGDLYEYMLSKLNTAGTNGQFRTRLRTLRAYILTKKSYLFVTNSILTFIPIPAARRCKVRREGFAFPRSSLLISACAMPVRSESCFWVRPLSFRASIIACAMVSSG